ncbi:MAG: iron-containing alcohol dehydrogenase [Spirochaetes bacterium]|nr:iron-containing alcohol dehydrogenase [Spirochaetota bacterium]
MKINYLYNPEIIIPDFLLKKIDIEELTVGENLLPEINKYLNINSARILLLCDRNTYEAAGRTVQQVMSENNEVRCLVLDADIHCDLENVNTTENSVNSADTLIAVGSGTINDIGRLVADRKKIDFYSVGTAPSMDGYLSANSSIIENGVKISHSGIKPAVKVIIDLDVMKRAPYRMFLSGIGDSVSKITSVFDWQLDVLIRKGSFNPEAAYLLNQSVLRLISVLLDEEKKTQTETLIEFLLLSGAVMNAEKNSQPASGGEHLIGHVLEMFDLKMNNKNHSHHGEKVAVSTYTVFRKYSEFFSAFIENIIMPGIEEDYFRQWDEYGIRINRDVFRTKLKQIAAFDFTDYDFQKKINEGMDFISSLKILFFRLYERYNLPNDNSSINVTNSDWDFALFHAGDLRERITGLDLINSIGK